jgi:hypothetical protein
MWIPKAGMSHEFRGPIDNWRLRGFGFRHHLDNDGLKEGELVASPSAACRSR